MSVVNCDVAVVGLGAMGSAILDQLAIRGVDVVGLDRFVPPHDRGSSHGSSRITREALGEGGAYVPFVQASHRRWRELEKETGVKLFEQCGAIMIGEALRGNSQHVDGDFIDTTFATAQRYGIKHERLGRQQVVSRYPQFSGMSEGDIAYYEPGAGYVYPEKCIEIQVSHAKSYGAKIYTEQIVSSLKNTESGVEISTDNLRVHARKAIVAAGAWTPGLLGNFCQNLFTVFRQTIFWFALEEGFKFPPNSPVYIWDHGKGETGFFYGFPPLSGENSVKVGGEQRHNTTDPDKLNRVVTKEEAEEMRDIHLNGRLNGVSDKVVKTYACLHTFTPDGSFIIDDHPEMQDVFVVSACSGHGFKHSAGIGEAVAQKICGEVMQFDLSDFRFDRFY